MATLTDEEMAALEAKEGHLSDEQMNARENANRSKPVSMTLGENIADKIRRMRQEAPSKARSALMGLTNNMGDRVESFVDTVTQNPDEQAGWVFDRSPEIHAKYMKDVKEQPGSNIIGAIAQPNPVGKLSAASKLGKVGAAAARVGYAGANNALSDYLGQTGPQAQDGETYDGVVPAMAMQTAAEIASPVAGAVANKLRRTAGTAAVNAAGMRGGIVNQPKRAGIHTLEEEGDDAIAALGNRMLDQDLIPFGGSKLAVQRRAEKLMDRTANAAEGLRNKGDALGGFDQAQGVKAAAERLEGRTNPLKGGNLQTARTADRAAEFITDASNTPNTFKAADDLKRGAYRSVNWNTEAPDATKLKRETISAYRQSMEDQLDGLIPGAGKDLHKVNEGYGLAAQTADFAEEAAGREAANSKFGPMQFMMGAAGAGAGANFGTGGAAAGAALPFVAHIAKTRGAALAASPMRLAGRVTGAVGSSINQSPAAASAASNALEQYLKPMDDEERQKEGAAWFTGQPK